MNNVIVILSGAGISRSEVPAESKDPYSLISIGRVGVLRLRDAVRFADTVASLDSGDVVRDRMTILICKS
jgi:hypothetical protein